jgi:DNA invertase Pin-like site-specific DNA recombinase
MSAPRQLRVAIYTRKSTEDGLEQDFNSLDAQREACLAFIASQKELGWTPLSRNYDDGGISGGTMDRPALQLLLDDIQAGQVDVVVVYKIDRLTRSLMDFARIVETFDQYEVPFVSVTQQFNTSTSMGRLTLNMLLSFAQFEREVTAERIRDKIAASKKKGMWMGGPVPLGYDAVDRKLKINEREAKIIRWLFATYLELGSVRLLKQQADARGIVSRTNGSRRSPGKVTGGVALSRGLLYRLLANPIYVGHIRHGKQTYPGLHDAIIDETTFEKVQALLNNKAPRRRTARNVTQPHLLTGLMFDDMGDRMSPSHASKKGQRYRYYISHRLMQARRKARDGWRLPAQHIETIILNQITSLLCNKVRLLDKCGLTECSPDIAEQVTASGATIANKLTSATLEDKRHALCAIIHRITLGADEITIEMDRTGLIKALKIGPDPHHPTFREPAIINLPIQLRRRGVEAKLVLTDAQDAATHIDPHLTRLIAQAHCHLELLTNGRFQSIAELAIANNIAPGEISRILPLAFLAPGITRMILEGRQPVELTAKRLSRCNTLPIEWKNQPQYLGIS